MQGSLESVVAIGVADAAVDRVLRAFRSTAADGTSRRSADAIVGFFLEPGALTDLAHALAHVDGATAAAALAPLERALAKELARRYLDEADGWRGVATLIVRTGLGAALTDGAGVSTRALHEMIDLVVLQTRWRGMENR